MINSNINFYGFFIMLSLIVYAITSYIIMKKENISNKDYLISLLYVILFVVFFGKFMTLIIDKRSFTFINFLKVGFSSLGGAIGAIIAILLYTIVFNKNKILFSMCYIVPLPLVYGVSKIGCFFAGCCYGIKYNGIFSIVYNYSESAPKGVSVFPIQILETILNIIIFIYLINRFFKRKNTNIILISKTFILCGLCKFLTDYLRYSHNNIILSSNQIICIIIIILGIFIIIQNKLINKYR